MTQAEGELLHEYALKFNDADVTRENKGVLIEGSVMMACCQDQVTVFGILDLDLLKKWGVYTTVVIINNRTKVL